MATIYELKEEYREIINKILFDELEDEDETKEIEKLVNLEFSIEDKAENTAIVLKELESEIEKFKKEEDRLSKKRKSMEKQSKRLKLGLEEVMKIMDKKKFKTEHFSFNIQKNVPSIVITNEDKALNEYQRVEIKLDKQRLKDDLKNGVELDYARLEQTESLRIR